MEDLRIKATADIKDLVENLDKGGITLEEFGKKVAKVSTTVGKELKSNSDRGGQALSNLGRIAQDAPYGFIGIQNNLNPLLESFQRLQKESGGTGGALKALGSSLVGPAGVGIALSVVSALLIKFPDALSSLSEETIRAKKVQSDYVAELAKGSATLSVEISKLTTLVEVARDENQSRTTRQNAIAELQKEYPGYLANINQENINSQATTKAINSLSDALSRKVKVQAITNLLTAEQEKNFKIQNGDLSDQVGLFEALKANYFGLGSIGGTAQRLLTKGTENQNKALQESQKSIDKYEDQLNKLLVTQAQEGDFKGLSPGRAAREKHLKAVLSLQEQLSRIIARNYKAEAELIAPTGTPTAPVGGNNTGQGLTGSGLGLEKGLGFESIILAQQKAAEGQIKFNEALAKTTAIASLISPVFEQAFASIANGENVFSSIGNAIKQLIIQLAQAAIKAAIFSIIINAFTGGAGGAPSFGALFKSFAGIPGHANGVTGSRGGMAWVGERGPELVRLPQGSDVIPTHRLDSVTGGGVQVFIPNVQFRGADMILQFKRATEQLNRQG